MEITHESLIGSFEQKQKLVSQFNLIHDDFFAVVMQNKPALETTLRTLLKKKDLIVTEVRIQYSIRNLVSHSVILDVLAEDSTGKLYNIEVQVKNEDDETDWESAGTCTFTDYTWTDDAEGAVAMNIPVQKTVDGNLLTSLRRTMFATRLTEFFLVMVK